MSPAAPPTASTFGGQVGRHEDTASLVVDDAGAGLREELVVRLRAPGHDEEVAARNPSVDGDGIDVRPPRPRASMFGGWPSRRSTTPTTSTPAAARSAAAPSPRSSAVMTNARSAGLIDQRLRRRRAPSESITPTRSLPGKDERLLHRAGRDDDARGTDLDERVAVRDRDEALLEEPDRDRRREQLDAGLVGAPPKLVGPRDGRLGRRAARRRQPGPSSTTITRSPRPAAAIAASSPDSPPPITTTSVCS